MRKRLFSFLGLCLIYGIVVAQPPSVQLKVAETSGFLGMGPPLTIELTLAAKSPDRPLSSEVIHSGEFFYFLLRSVGEWTPDEDFASEELPKLSILQKGKKFQVMWKGEPSESDSSLLIGFGRDLVLREPFEFRFDLEGEVQSAEVRIPVQYWAGYDVLKRTWGEADRLVAEGRYRSGILLYNQLLSTDTLRQFPQIDSIRTGRTTAFGSMFSSALSQFDTSVASTSLPVKKKIEEVDAALETAQFVNDSLPSTALAVSASDPSVSPILGRIRSSTHRIQFVRDSLQRVYDDESIRWILTGDATGRNGYLFQYIVETLAYAFTSVDFADTAAQSLSFSIPEEMTDRLEKHALTESYRNFLRVCNDRFKDHMPVFPVEFLPNLRKDTAAFALPFYSMLRCVNDYFYGLDSTALAEIYHVFKTCYEPDLNERLDRVRVLIGIRLRNYPPEALRLIREARDAERRGESTAALERFHQATIIAPTFPYAAFSLGQYYMRTGDPIRALPFFQKAYQLDSLYLSAYREAYSIYRRTGNYKPMIEVLTNARDHGNDYWETNFNLGIAHFGNADPARAIQSFERALRLNPKSYETNIQLGLTYQSIKEYQRAREYFHSAINIDALRQEAVDFLNKLNEVERSER